MMPLYGYSKIGEPLCMTGFSRAENYSLVAAITKSEVLGYQIFRGSVAAEEFGAFIMSLLQSKPQILESCANYIFFIDGATIHKAKLLKPFLQNFQLFYNAPYSPFINPIEEYFGHLKLKFREKIKKNTVNIAEKIAEAASEIDNALLFSSYIHSVTFLENCLDKKSIL